MASICLLIRSSNLHFIISLHGQQPPWYNTHTHTHTHILLSVCVCSSIQATCSWDGPVYSTTNLPYRHKCTLKLHTRLKVHKIIDKLCPWTKASLYMCTQSTITVQPVDTYCSVRLHSYHGNACMLQGKWHITCGTMYTSWVVFTMRTQASVVTPELSERVRSMERAEPMFRPGWMMW